MCMIVMHNGYLPCITSLLSMAKPYMLSALHKVSRLLFNISVLSDIKILFKYSFTL